MPASQVGQHPRTLGQHQQNLHHLFRESFDPFADDWDDANSHPA